jgi:hypothetical protein
MFSIVYILKIKAGISRNCKACIHPELRAIAPDVDSVEEPTERGEDRREETSVRS